MNVLLYWEATEPGQSVLDVVETWKRVCPDWNIALHSGASASDYLRAAYGGDFVKTFDRCALPAMRSDFFRVFWALNEGGVYCDLTFTPTAPPMFFDPAKRLTVPRWPHGRIVNGIFRAEKNAPELRLVAYEILKGMSQQQDNNLWSVTGPGAWIRALEGQDVEVVERNAIFGRFFELSNYASSTRDTPQHWAERQKNMSIYA